MLNVLITIDTEVHPINKDWRSDSLLRDMRRDIEGLVDGRNVGLDYQLDILARNGIKATFFVESLFSGVPEVGTEPLKSIIRRIRKGGHDIQLHLHCEWIPHCQGIGVPFRSHLQNKYDGAEQERLISFATERLQECGASKPIAFRAGGYSADEPSLNALKNLGFKYDTSFNIGYLDKCKLPGPPSFGVRYDICGIQEIPVAAFQDYPGHFRPAQICACSASEMIHALNKAEEYGWKQFVIVSHSFEMLSGRRTGRLRIRNEVLNRFEKLCAHLGKHGDKFRTVGFHDLDHFAEDGGELPAAIKWNLLNTAGRYFSQGLNRIRGR